MEQLVAPKRDKKSSLLTMKQIGYMKKIIDSDLPDEEKAYIIGEYCDQRIIRKTIDSHTNYGEYDCAEVVYLTKILKAYREYVNQGYIIGEYDCTLRQLKTKISKLKEVNYILKSNDIDYIKVEKLISLFESSEEFEKEYIQLIKFGKFDPMLNPIRYELDNFNNLLNKFKKYENRGIIKDVKYLINIESYHRNYEYAKFAINYYIDSKNSYRTKEFLKQLGLDDDTFNFCVETIKELDVYLYKNFLEKKEKNKTTRFIMNSKTISNISYGIQNGHLKNGIKFDVLEFIRMVPFKSTDNFITNLMNFTQKSNPKDYNIIWNYICKNRLNSKNAFEKINLKKLNDPNTKVIVNNIEITEEINNIIIDYIKINDIPLINKAYYIVRNKYVNGEIDIEKLNKQKENIKYKNKTIILIPSTKQSF